MIFRILGLAILLQFSLTLWRLRRRRVLVGGVFLLYQIVIVLIGLSFAFPDGATRVANLVGITRGADFGVYSLSLLLLFLSFHLVRYNRQNDERFQTLVRELALRDAVRIDRTGP